MNYREIHLINNATYISPNEIRSTKYCPREEIAHPHKLCTIIENIPTHWDTHTYDHNPFYCAWFQWNKEFVSYDKHITTSLFHIVVERPAMFKTFKDIIENIEYSNKGTLGKIDELDEDEIDKLNLEEPSFSHALKEWLVRWWNCPFLITIPILHDENGPFLTNNTYSPIRISLNTYTPQEYLSLQLNHRSYTVANGLTLFLAYHRMGLINASITAPILREFVRTHDPYIFQDINDSWHDLYYGNNVAQIADFPAYYICTGPNFAHENIIRIFEPLLDYNFALNIYPTGVIYTSPYSAMFPHFNAKIWEQFRENEDWLNLQAVDRPAGDVIYPDISGIFHGVMTTKGSWRYWLNNFDDILMKLAECYISRDKLLEEIFQTCSYFYKYGSPHIYKKFFKKKVRHIWNASLFILDFNKQIIPIVFTRYLLKYHMYSRFKALGHYMENLLIHEMPYGLLKDILKAGCDKITMYNIVKFHIISNHIDVIRTVYSDIEYSAIPVQVPDNGNQGDDNVGAVVTQQIVTIPRYIIHRNNIRIFKDSIPRTIMSVFYNTYIEKTVISRLCTVYKSCGMFSGEGTLYDSYTVGKLIIDFLKTHKDYLIL